MPGENGLTLSKRKHGVCVPGLGLFSSVLVALCCVEVWGSEPRGCSPCPLNCSCALVGPLQSCSVNCSNIGLEKAPAAADLPLATTVLDLSKNHISSLDSSLLDHLSGLRELYLQGNRINVLPRGVFCCGPLSVLDLSNNQITTLKERICDDPCNLTQIDLSSNPFDCDCKLVRLVSWLQKKGVRVRRPESMLCNQPPELHQRPLLNISRTCVAACLEDSGSVAGGRRELVIFSSSTPGNFSREQCTGVCLMSAHRYGGLGSRRECLCSTNSEPNFISESHCSAACTNPHVMEECGWTLANDVFAVDFSVSVKPVGPQSVHDQVRFSAASSVSPVTLSWDFGDRSPRVNTSETEATKATHKYGLPGQYKVGVTAWIGHKEQASAQGEVTVMLPPKLQLLCPVLSVANKTLEVPLLSWGALGLSIDWKINRDNAEVAKASPHCPGGVVHNETSHCFEILPEEMNWTDARHQCLDRGGDLAIVRSETLRGLLSLKVTQERGVWLGLSDVQFPGKLLWVNGSEATEGEEGPPPRSVITRGNMCISLDQRGQTSSHPCNIKRAYVCEHKPQVRVPDAGVYMVGLAVFPTHNPLLRVQADLLLTPKPTSGGIEVLLFPALSFVHAGRMSSLDFDTLELQTQIQIRFQIYRPYCHYLGLHLLLPGCGGVACAPVAVCVSVDSEVRDSPSCPPLKQWCPFQQQCLALSIPCQPASCANCSQAHTLPPRAFRPRYVLQNEVVFTLPSGPSAHILIQEQVEDLLVSPGDVFALQHDAGPGSLFHCQHSPHSPWHQSVLAINQSEWFWLNNTGTSEESGRVPDPELDIEALVVDGEARWLQEVVCPVRVLYAGHSETQLQGERLITGLAEPGLYSLTVFSADPSYPASDTCMLRVVPPLGLTIIHPTLQNGSIYLQPNDTRILLRVQSRYSTNATWSGANRTVTFLATCPSEFVSRPGLCQPSANSRAELTEPSQYAVLDLGPGLERPEHPLQLELEAHNNVTEASLSVVVHLEEPLLELVVDPDPARRVLMESVVSYTASAPKGSNPTFKWTVDDKPYFTYYNTVLNVIYQHAAIYKLTVTAMNHVSTITKHFNVTVDRLVPMANLSVQGVPDVVPQGSTQTFTTSVLLDMSVPATFRWCFRDGGYKEFEYKPPYPLSLQSPDSPNQVLLSNNVTYVYSQPGIYPALVSVSNRYENISQTINMSVYSILNHVDIQTEPPLLLVGQPAEFEAHPLPSPYGIHYDWHFGNTSAPMQGRRVTHTYTQSGAFNICVFVNNTISSLTACAEMFVFEKIVNLTANSSSPSELHCPTLIWADIRSGNNVTWTFSMGDGSVHTVSEPFISHYYTTDGNYTVNVTASNAVSFASTVLPIHVFEFKVVRIEPSGCLHENTPINFLAFVTGNASAHLYEWKFGDDSAIERRHGSPHVSHTFETSGNYNLTLTISSGVSKATKNICVCVQPALKNISFNPEKTHYAVEQEILFEVKAEPNFNYSYEWDFGQGDDTLLVQGSGNVVKKYTDPGQYVVTVTVFNSISSLNASISIEIQRPIGSVVILHNGTKYNNFTLREPYAFYTSTVATNVSYTWDFGDGFVQNSASVIHAFNASQNYNITLTAVNTISSNQTVLPVAVLAPIRNLTLNSSLINVPLNASVNFEAHMDEGDGVRFSWILCDHCSSIVGTNTMFYTFRSVGTFTIIVIAENDLNTTQASILLFVQRELEELSILHKDEICGSGPIKRCWYATNRMLHLQAELKEGTNMTFTWNLIRELEPHSSIYNITGKTVEVNFSTPGPCDIVLRAANRLGHLTKNRTIYFLEPAEIEFLKVSQNPVAVHSPINMTVVANKGSDLQYRWSINKDVLEWSMPSQMHSFDTPGLKLVEVEVFNEVSSETVSETISVQEIITGLQFTATNMTEQSYVSTGYIVWLQGNVTTGTNVTWTWTIDGQIKTGKKTFYIFHDAKRTVITLKASNDISEQVESREVVAQDRISGLELKANAQNVAVGEKVEFNITLAAGTDAQIILSISGDNTMFVQPNQIYVHIFTRVDTYMVNVTAHNQVSFKKFSLQVQVYEPIRGLSILGCCPIAIPVGVKKTFVAHILTGSAVSFLWTFDLHHSLKTPHVSKEVTYVPQEPGVLTIYLKAFNSLHYVNITKDILVQNRLNTAVLYAAPRDTFINKTVTLMALVTPQHTAAHCLWEMGDGSSGIYADTTIGYIYKQPSHYFVQVNCSNQVSWVLGQVEVNITVLECEEPEVQVVQAPHLSIWRAQPTLVEANVDLKGCARYGEQYLWQILAASSCDNNKDDQVISEPPPPVPVIHLSEVDMRRLQLSLPKMSLPAGSYSLVFSLSYEGVPLRKAACLQLSVMHARLVPIIEGGTYRVWSRTQDLQLSAEQSYDPNMDPESQSPLDYAWKCVGTSKGPEHCSTLNSGLGHSGAVLGISRAVLEAGVEYTFNLTIRKVGMAPASTTQTVLVKSGHIPIVSLTCVSCKAQSFYKVSENSYVYLKGTCTNCEGFHRGRWSAKTSQNDTLVLDSSSTTTGSHDMNLVLRQGVLREGDSYIFTLHVNDSALDGEGAASITLHRNMPPTGGECHLKAGGDAGMNYTIEDSDIRRIQTLVDRVNFNCSGFSDVGVSETPLLYSLLVTRCKEDYCEEFCVYRGSSPEHSAFLPPGFSSSQHRVAVSITVEDHQGATNTALNKSIKVGLPNQPLQYSSLPHWLSDLTDIKLKKLLEQGDSQRVRELSLALITVLNEYEQTKQQESQDERLYRVRVRSNITRALTSLDLTTVNDIQQTSAALAQCTAVSREFICEECQNSTLNKLESMLKILQTDTKQGTVTPTEIADNILNIMGDLIHQVSQSTSQMYVTPAYVDAPSQPPYPFHPSHSPLSSPMEDHVIFDPLPPSLEHHPLRVAAKAYSLSSVLMLILMHARVLNEEPLRLRGAEIAATGKLADPQSLLCYHGNISPECQRFSIPRAFNKSLGKAAAGNSIMQLLFQVESNPFPFNYVPNYTVSTEVASMEFRTENGTQIPISGLDDSLAITVAVNNGTTGSEGGFVGSNAPGLTTSGSVNISHCDSVIVKVNARNTNRQAGLFVQLNFTSMNNGRRKDRDIDEEEPYITAYLHHRDEPNEFNCIDHKLITLNMTQGPDLDHKKFTFFLSPESYDTTLEYFINVSTPCSPNAQPVGVRLEVGVFASLCQYFNESDKQWRTDGMVPLAETNATRAVCRTRHLTAFAASIFVPPNAVSFKIPERYGTPSHVVLLVCVLGLLSYVVAAAILHKLDQLDLRRAGVVPLCGQDGLFKYEVQVKTGWSQGAGTTAHVGISLYGRESRSGHRHLDSRGAFTRNALDIFHIATDTSLGSVWKIRIWHDNKGLSPAWLLQYVLVKDLQTGSSYYFLVDDWLSVDNDRTGRKVEIEVEASEDAALRHLPRLLRSELERAVCESHLWLSLWERPARSPFTRLQRTTCCALLLQLILMANTLWYSIVVDKRMSPRAVSTVTSLNGETVAAGVVICLIVYPLYLLAFTLFRMSRSKCVTVEQVPPQVDQESVEIDDFLDNSIAGSSFLFFSGETNSEETNVDLPTPSTKSDDSSDFGDEYMEDRDWPELMSEGSEMGGAGHGAGLPTLKRSQGSRHLGMDIAFNPDNEDGQHNKYFTSSDEDLIKHILADGQNFFPQADESEMADLSSIFGDKTEVILLQKLNEPLPLETVRRDPPKTAFSSNTVVTDVCRPRRFPPWCGQAALWGSWVTITLANVVSIWAGHGFNQKVAMMWLISCFASVLCSCLLLEPVKVICEAVYFALCVRRLRPEDQDVLVEFPRVERVVQRVHRVRPPQGFALSQARHQARKVHMLHTMLKNFLVYMFLLLVVILLNYSDSAKDTHSLRLRTQLQHALHTPEYHSINSRADIVTWLNDSLLPRLLDDSRLLQDTGSVLLGPVRLRQVHNVEEKNVLDDPAMTSPSVAKRARRFGKRTALERDLIHLLNRTLGEAVSSLEQLQRQHWLNYRTRAVAVDFSLYNINTNLLAVFSFLFNFPVSDRAQCSLDLLVTSLWPVTGLDLPLLLTMVLFVLAVYFLVRGVLGYLRQGYTYLLSSWRVMGVCKLILALTVCGLHLSRCVRAKQQWAFYLTHPRDVFTDFSALARQSQLFTVMAALLLFILVLKASHQLRFLREWAVFGRALRRSGWELLSLALALLLLLLAYAHAGHLLFHSVFDGYSSVGSACLSLMGTGGRGLLFWRPVSALNVPSGSASTLMFHTSFAALRLVLVWFVIAVLLRNYRRARAELYRPAVDLQDYEMVELFLRRLKMWMGLSRAKEFRHKVRFEGMDLPPSRSSSTSDCRSLCLPPLDRPDSPSTPDSVDAGSEASWRPASSSPCSLTEAPGATLGLGLGLGLGLSPGVLVGGATWKQKAETEAALGRVLPTLDALLQQLDRVTIATEDLYYVECKMEKAQRKRRLRGETGPGPNRQQRGPREDAGGWRERKSGKEKQKTKKGKKMEKSDAKDTKKTPVATPVPFFKSKSASSHIAPNSKNKSTVSALDHTTHLSSCSTFTPPHAASNKSTPAPPPSTPAPSTSGPSTSGPSTCASTPTQSGLSSLFNHPAHTTTIPTRKRKRKPPPLKNKVHPN